MTRPSDAELLKIATAGAQAIRPAGRLDPDDTAALEARRRLGGHAAAWAARARANPTIAAGVDPSLDPDDLYAIAAAEARAAAEGKPDAVDEVLDHYLGPPAT